MIVSTTNLANIQLAAELLNQGKLVAIPTETVYGLGADAKNPEAIKRIFAAKGRPADHPLIVHIPNKVALDEWAIEIPDDAWKLAEHFWPGPLTLVLKKHPDVPMEVTGGQNTVALRVPNHPVALELLKAFGGGIAAPSANRFCRISPTQASHVEEELGDKVDMILDGGACQVGLESTIVDLSGQKPRLLRPGQISKSEIESVLQQPLLLPEENEKIHAPGMMEVHYAPITKTFLCTHDQLKGIFQDDAFKHQNKVGILSFGREINSGLFDKVIVMPITVNDYGQLLYSKLRELDHANLDLILVEQPSQTEGWRGVNDRLAKATKPLADIELKKICIQIKSYRFSDFELELIQAIGEEIASNKELISHFEIQKEKDKEKYMNIMFETNALKNLWYQIQTKFFQDLAIGLILGKSSIVVCEGKKGWDDYLLLYHFNKLQKLDNL
jgi:L-threonylcarbamoyladenylate synthase